MYKKSKNIISNNLMISLILPAFVSCNTKPKDEGKGADSETEIDYQKVDPLKIESQILKKAGVGKINSDFLDEDAKFNEDEYKKKKGLFQIAEIHKGYIKNDGTVDIEKAMKHIATNEFEKLVEEKKGTLGNDLILSILKANPILKSLVDDGVIESNGAKLTINKDNKVSDPKKVTISQINELSEEVIVAAINKAIQDYTSDKSLRVAEVKDENGNKSIEINAELLLKNQKIISEGKNPFVNPKTKKAIEKPIEIAKENPQLFLEIISGGLEQLNAFLSSDITKVKEIKTLEDPSNEKDLLEAIKKAEIFNKSLYKDKASSESLAQQAAFSGQHKGIKILENLPVILKGVDVETNDFKDCFGDQSKPESKVTESRAGLAKSSVLVGVSYINLSNSSFNTMKKDEVKYYYSVEADQNETFYVYEVKCNVPYVTADPGKGIVEAKGEYQVKKIFCRKADNAHDFSEKFINETSNEKIWSLKGKQLTKNAATDINVAKEIANVKDPEFFKELMEGIGISKYTADQLKNALNEVTLHSSALEVLNINDTKFDGKSFIDSAASDANGVSKVQKLFKDLMDTVKQKLGPNSEYEVSDAIVLSALKKSFPKLKDLAGGSQVVGRLELKHNDFLGASGAKIDSIEVSRVVGTTDEFVISLCLEPKQVVDGDTTLGIATSAELKNQSVTRQVNHWIANKDNDNCGDGTVLISTIDATGVGVGALANTLDCKAGLIAGAVNSQIAGGVRLKHLKEKGKINIVGPAVKLERNDNKVDVPIGTRLLEKKIDSFTLKLNFVVDLSKKIDADDTFLKNIFTSVEFNRYFGRTQTEEDKMVAFEGAFHLEESRRISKALAGGLKATICTVEFIGKNLIQS
jgi:hypothetical protein